MEAELIFSSVLSTEWVVYTMWEALATGTALLAQKCLLWLLLETGSLPVDVFQVCQLDKRLPLPLRRKEGNDDDDDAGKPNDDAGKINDDAIHKEGYNDDHDNGIEDHLSGEEGNSDQESDNYSGSYSDGGNDDDMEEDGDGVGDGDEGGDDDDDDTDMEDYYDDDEEESDEEDQDKSEDDTSSSEDSTDDNSRYPWLKNARNVYTSDTFLLFEHERRKSKTLDIDVISDMDVSARGLKITYELGKLWHYYRPYTVTAMPMDGIVECSCKYFEFSGVLCSHAQVVLRCLHIVEIPERYILQRDKSIPTGPAEGVHTLIKNQEDHHQSSPNCTEFNRSPGPGRDIISGSQAGEEIRTDYVDPPLLRHARDVYSSNIFNMFKEEYKKSEYLFAREVDFFYEGGIIVNYEVEKPGHRYRRHTVRAVPDDGTVNCNCKKFDKTGVLCSHAIVVLDYLCIVKIPGQYIVDKFKKDGTVSSVQEIHGPGYPKVRSFLRYKAVTNSFKELLETDLKSLGTRRLLAFEKGLDELKDLLKGMRNKQGPEEVVGDSQSANGKSTSATTQEPTLEENTGSHNDLTSKCTKSQESGKVDQSTVIISVAPSFATQNDAANN